MRSSNGWHLTLSRELTDVMATGSRRLPARRDARRRARPVPAGTGDAGAPGRDAWTLFGGYPYARGVRPCPDGRASGWRSAGPATTCGPCAAAASGSPTWSGTCRCRRSCAATCWQASTRCPHRRSPARAAGRFEKFEDLLTSPPEFARRHIPLATAGQYLFPVRDRRHSVTFTRRLPPAPAAATTWRPAPEARASAVTVTWEDLQAAAAEMDRNEASLPAHSRATGQAGCSRVKLLVRQQGGFAENVPLSIDGLLHLVGMVGAGKSTLRDILTYWYVTRDTGAQAAGDHRGRRRGRDPGGRRAPSPASGLPPRRSSARPPASATSSACTAASRPPGHRR